MRRLSRLDRRLGASIRGAMRCVPGGARGASAIASGMSPGFRVAVGLLVAGRGRRGTGLRALVAGAAAATAARLLRDRLGRRRPGARQEGGFPSRHAAAAAAIAAAVWRREPAIGRGLAAAAVAGALARVATAEHEPGDIVAGAALGLSVAWAVERAADRLEREPPTADSPST